FPYTTLFRSSVTDTRSGTADTERAAGRKRSVVWLLGAGVALAAINLRTALTSVGPVLDEVTVGLGLSCIVAGVLTTLPVLCFAAFGAATPALIRRFG